MSFTFFVSKFCHTTFRLNIDYRKLSTLVVVGVYDRLFSFDLREGFVKKFYSLIKAHSVHGDFSDSAGHGILTISCVPVQFWVATGKPGLVI